MMHKINVFCPIETINRELDFRLFLAALGAAPHLRFVIGHRYTIYDLLMEIGGGIYLGQNMRPAGWTPLTAQHKERALKRLNAMRAQRTLLMVLDEEGGVMAGDEARWRQWLDFRLDVPALQAGERVCTWGDFQRDYYRAQVHAGAQAGSTPSLAGIDAPAIVTTGHPRFDLYKPALREFYRHEQQHWKERFGNFVLINTNFAWANHAKGMDMVFPDRWQERYDGEKRIDMVRQWSHISRVRAQMVSLVMRLSVERPDSQFVIRPHPSENMRSYQSIFSACQNVHVLHEGSVGGWLLAAQALIHDGCTTAIEAHFCDLPILNYKSLSDTRYDLLLPNALGTTCTTEEQVLSQLENLSHAREKSVVPDFAMALIENFQRDAFALLIEQLHLVAENTAPSEKSDSVLRGYRSKNRFRPAIRRVKRELRGRRGKAGQRESGRFEGLDEVGLQEKFERVREITQQDVRLNVLSDRVFTMEL